MQLSIAALTTNLADTKGAVEAQLQALSTRHAENDQSLAVVTAELEQDKTGVLKEVQDKIAAHLSVLKAQLEKDIDREHTLMRTKLNTDVQKLHEEQNLLKAMSAAQQDQIASDVGFEESDETVITKEADTRLKKIEDVIQKGETLLDGKVTGLLAGLKSAKTDLVVEMARIAGERLEDEAAWRSKIFVDNNVTQDREAARMQAIESSVQQDLADVMSDMRRLIAKQTVKTHESFDHVTKTVTELTAEQHKENMEQAAWLETLMRAVREATKKMEDDMQQLREKLTQTDSRLTRNTVALDDLQTNTIENMNYTLTRDLDAVNASVHAAVWQDSQDKLVLMTNQFNAARLRIGQLGSSVNTTCDAQQQAVLALKNTFLRQNAARHNEMATLERDAGSTKTYLQRRLEVHIHTHIQHNTHTHTCWMLALLVCLARARSLLYLVVRLKSQSFRFSS